MLWARTSTFYDAMTDEEKKAHPEIVQELEPLAAKLRTLDASYATGEPINVSRAGNKNELEKQMSKLMARVDAKKYSSLGINRSTSEVGVSIQTPVTDGKFIRAQSMGHGGSGCPDRGRKVADCARGLQGGCQR